MYTTVSKNQRDHIQQVIKKSMNNGNVPRRWREKDEGLKDCANITTKFLLYSWWFYLMMIKQKEQPEIPSGFEEIIGVPKEESLRQYCGSWNKVKLLFRFNLRVYCEQMLTSFLRLHSDQRYTSAYLKTNDFTPLVSWTSVPGKKVPRTVAVVIKLVWTLVYIS